MQAINRNEAVDNADLLAICQSAGGTEPAYLIPGYNFALKKYLISKRNVFIFSMLQSRDGTSFDILFSELVDSNEPQVSCSQFSHL